MKPTAELMHDPLDELMTHLRHLPLWMKQVVYTEMKVDLEDSLSKPTLDSFDRQECLQLLVPHLSVKGSQELHQPSGRFPPAMQELLRRGHQSMNVASICVALQWTLEQCCTVMLKAYQSELLVPCPSSRIEATIRYLANETRLGEYLVQIEKLTWTQLEQALNTQQYIQAVMGEKTGIGEVLINLGFVSRQDSEAILFLKEESKKAFIVNKGLPLYLGQTAVGGPPPTVAVAEGYPTPHPVMPQGAPSTLGHPHAGQPILETSGTLYDAVSALPAVAPAVNPASGTVSGGPSNGAPQPVGMTGYDRLRHSATALGMSVKEPVASPQASLKLPPPPQPQPMVTPAPVINTAKPATAPPEKGGLFARLPIPFK